MTDQSVPVKASDRRLYDRVPVDLSIRIRRGDAVVIAPMINLSIGGFLVKTSLPVQLDQRLPVQLGQRAAVDFTIDGDAFALDAVLIRIEGEGVAFQFVDPSAEVQRKLAMHLDRIESLSVGQVAKSPIAPLHR